MEIALTTTLTSKEAKEAPIFLMVLYE